MEEYRLPEFNITNILETPTLLNDLNYAPWNKLYKKELFDKYGKYNTSFKIVGDYDFNLRLIYKNKITSKVGLMNIFDYHVNAISEDYFHINATSQVGSMEYVYYKNGLLKL